MKHDTEKFDSLLKESAEVFRFVSSKTKILATLSWPESFAEEFFHYQASRVPHPQYPVDKTAMQEAQQALYTLRPKIQGDHPALKWLQRTWDSFESGVQLLLNIGTPEFFSISQQTWGSSGTTAGRDGVTLLELAKNMSAKLMQSPLIPPTDTANIYTAESFANALEAKLRARTPKMAIRVEIVPQISAEVAASASRVRIRKGAEFSAIELAALWNHEIESHSLTGQNGMLQTRVPFLSGGGPRTTRAQEGLAVFYEMYGKTMTRNRFARLCNRIYAVQMVEEGADFVELYRWFLPQSQTMHEAFYDAQRVFRGADLTGRYPFTKDVVYMAGLLEVCEFLHGAVSEARQTSNRTHLENFLVGRIALEDIEAMRILRESGLVVAPFYTPPWLEELPQVETFLETFFATLES